MASRRMFSHSVITTDKFQSLSRDSQFLYIHLGMHADDDGFLGSPLMLANMISCGKETLLELEEKGYLIFFPSGVCAITHWHQNNYIPKDRYTKSVYREEKSHLVIENGVYRYSEEVVCEPCAAASLEAQEKAPNDEAQKLTLGAYQNVYLTEAEYEALKREFPNYTAMIENLSRKIAMHGYRYKNHYVVLVEWAKEDMEKVAKQRTAPVVAGSFRAQTMDTYQRMAEELEKRQFGLSHAPPVGLHRP